MENVIDLLEKRGFIDTLSDPEFKNVVNKPINIYCGFDPTGDSLHVGHLIPMIGLKWFQKFGHKPYAIVGGATGMIGDPSGKSKERNLLTAEQIDKNTKGIEKNLRQILSFSGDNSAILLNNYDWIGKFNFIEFLREVGKHFRLSTMLSKESVKMRLESEEGMSFTEFCYQVLQGFDFLYLYKHHNVIAQMGGSDQWGNITAGCELTRRVEGHPVFALTFPLLTRSDGKKFGKTEEGAVWLSKEKTTPYEFYQYFYRIPDADVIKMMKLLTLMDLSEIKKYEPLIAEQPNVAQKRLAEEVTKLVHGQEALDLALQATQVAKPGMNAVLEASSLIALKGEVPFYQVSPSQFFHRKLMDLIVELKIQESKGEFKRLVKNGGLYLNNQKVLDENQMIEKESCIEGRLILVSLGKKQRVVIEAQ